MEAITLFLIVMGMDIYRRKEPSCGNVNPVESKLPITKQPTSESAEKHLTAESAAKAFLKNPVEIVMVVDVGSSSIRCTPFYFDSLTPFTGANVKLPIAIVSPDMKQHSPNVDEICNNIDDAIRIAMRSIDSNYINFSVIAIGFSSFNMNLFAVDSHNNVISSLMTYACTSTFPGISNAIKTVEASGNCTLHHTTTGSILNHPAYAPVQLVAYLQQGGAQPYKLQTLSQRMIGRWSGLQLNTPMSTCEASWTGMMLSSILQFDVYNLILRYFFLCLTNGIGLLSIMDSNWDDKAIELIGINLDSFPTLSDYNEFPATYALPESRHELAGARLFLGLGDGACAAVGSHCISPNRVSVTIGTSAAVRVLVSQELWVTYIRIHGAASLPYGLWVYRVSKDLLLVGGALNDGGSIIQWFQTIIGRGRRMVSCQHRLAALYQNPNKFVERGEQREYPIVMPFWTGERSTSWRSDATGTIHGITRETTKVDLLFALMEGICWRLEAILTLLADIGFVAKNTNTELVVSGTALECNAMWRQLLADTSGLRVKLLSESVETTSAGVALMIASQLKKKSNEFHPDLIHGEGENEINLTLDSAIEISKEISTTPSEAPELHQFLQRRKTLHQQLYSKTLG